jgi:hypothetical protein
LKVYAAQHGLKLRDVVAESLEKQLQYGNQNVPVRSALPRFRKASSTGAVIPNRTNGEIEAILDKGDH